MSANNGILIKHNTFEVFYQCCWDNGLTNASLIGKGKNLEEAYEIAKKWQEEDGDWYLEYGIQLI